MTLEQTPSQTVGPFFHYGLVNRGDEHILVNDNTKGLHILIKGQVTDGSGSPINDAMLEIWQADAQGYFNHPEDPNHEKADPNFKGFGRAVTNDNGVYTFQTIKPGRVPYDAETVQAPHISVRLFARGMLIHTYTRLYFGDEQAANDRDPVLNLVPENRRQTLIALPDSSGEAGTYRFNISLQGDNETVFFEP